ncbi:MAG: phosphate ABC transporter permease PstA [Candidatus Bipolaricaulota bacterium]|nr:phosphate ABC transporter permease PstA [Candidatus Bipolaricaulota bacterium]
MAAVAFPLGIAAAIYLEEYARQTRFTAALEVLVASLAGLPSAVVGLLGLEIFARAMNLGRSILAGGFTLAVLVLPLVIIASREALRTVPRTLREAAFSVGATPWQTVRHHVLPYALPGILTGVVLSLSRALGEAAPLLFLGAFLYVTYVPQSLRDSFTVVPIQIFDWATRPQDGYAVVAACAILVLLGLVLLLNALAILLRARFQRRWAE